MKPCPSGGAFDFENSQIPTFNPWAILTLTLGMIAFQCPKSNAPSLVPIFEVKSPITV